MGELSKPSLVNTRTWKREFFVLVWVCFTKMHVYFNLIRSPPRGPVLKWTFFYKLIDTFSTLFNATVGSLLVLSSWGSVASSAHLFNALFIRRFWFSCILLVCWKIFHLVLYLIL